MSRPYEILDPVEIPGWGQISYSYIEDAITWANYALETGGAAYALRHYETELQRLVDLKVWRSPAAHDLLTRLLPHGAGRTDRGPGRVHERTDPSGGVACYASQIFLPVRYRRCVYA